MAENIGGTALFGSICGHRWIWGRREIIAKRLATVGTDGEARMVLHSGCRRCVIAGEGGPAVLIAPAADRAAADALLTVLEAAIEDRQKSGVIATWEDDAGRTGPAIVIEDYERIGPRQYGLGESGSGAAAWQFYRCYLLELTGAPG